MFVARNALRFSEFQLWILKWEIACERVNETKGKTNFVIYLNLQRAQSQRQRFLWHDSIALNVKGATKFYSITIAKCAQLESVRMDGEGPACVIQHWHILRPEHTFGCVRLLHSGVECVQRFFYSTIQDLSNRVFEPKMPATAHLAHRVDLSGSDANVRNYFVRGTYFAVSSIRAGFSGFVGTRWDSHSHVCVCVAHHVSVRPAVDWFWGPCQNGRPFDVSRSPKTFRIVLRTMLGIELQSGKFPLQFEFGFTCARVCVYRKPHEQCKRHTASERTHSHRENEW